jgi:formylmethanofuran:tetrahydromethanopterin formyltransferase
VRALEWNGNTVYSNIFNLDPVEVDNIILVKNGNEYFWKTHLTEGNYLIRVYNISGKLIIEERFGHRTGEAAGNFCIRQPGWYILVIQGKEKYSRMFTNY